MDFAKIAPKFLKIYSIEMNLNLKYEVNLPRTLLLRCSHYTIPLSQICMNLFSLLEVYFD